jgi:FHA domain
MILGFSRWIPATYVLFGLVCLVIGVVAAKKMKDRAYALLGGAGLTAYGIWGLTTTSGTFYYSIKLLVLAGVAVIGGVVWLIAMATSIGKPKGKSGSGAAPYVPAPSTGPPLPMPLPVSDVGGPSNATMIVANPIPMLEQIAPPAGAPASPIADQEVRSHALIARPGVTPPAVASFVAATSAVAPPPRIPAAVVPEIARSTSTATQYASAHTIIYGHTVSESPTPTGSAKLVARNEQGEITSEIPLVVSAVVGRFDPTSGPVDVDLSNLSGGEQISRQHARLEKGSDGWTVIDNDSANGVHIKPVGARSFSSRLLAPHRLSPGDQIAFGTVVLAFEID